LFVVVTRLAHSARLAALALTLGACAAGSAPPAVTPPPTAGAAGADAGAAGVGAAGSGDAQSPETSVGSGDARDTSASEAAAGSAGARPCAALPLCDDFEGAAAGGKPDPARWTVGAPNVTGTGALAVDDTQSHSGTRSVKVTGQGGYSNHIFFTNGTAIGALGPVVWGRFYVRLTDALGDGHVTFLAMKDTHDGGKYLRMGGQGKILMWNRESDDATVPALSPAGIGMSRPLPTGRWLCVEFNVDGAQGLLRTWIDGEEVAGTRIDATSTPDVDEQWLRKPDWRPALTDFALGWESYAGQAMTLWFDDVALDATRVGCPRPM
jgi:hypothetical protein